MALKETLAIIATLAIVISYIPQIARAFKTKTLHDVSIYFLGIILFATFLWIAYAIVAQDNIILYANLFIGIFVVILTCQKVYYGHKHS
jgi:MtN3 and saliva related transmembrane protein